ncbi:hypothetical protein KY290_010749 [Solanum tuberosum]|uniref:Uncharacterized protein n=1 Tax=Solanum tuberosum TaxID=4113 RepID=A0ABQ7W198_SOLTU|nr:hypothetical protein KY290_010749 [Solanum tuberosum]
MLLLVALLSNTSISQSKPLVKYLKGSSVRDSAARCRLGWQEQHLLGYGEVVEPIVKDKNANNTPKRAKSLKNASKIVR